MIFLRGLSLPSICSAARTDIKIEAPPNLYEPVPSGKLAFYRNIWISPGLQLYDRRSQQWHPLPRLFSGDADGFSYLCLHPDPVAPGKNVLDFIRVIDLFMLNPRLKASASETL